MRPLAWGARVPEWFRNRAVTIAAEVGVNPSHLMACMKFESNFDPEARNPKSSASGLIQWMTATAIEMGTTIEAIRAMTAMEQLELVGQYFKMRQQQFGKIRTLSDCYMAILAPGNIGKADDAVIFPAGSKNYLANQGLDLNHDNEVTKAEAAAFVEKALAEGMRPGNVSVLEDTQPAAPYTQPAAPIEDYSAPLPTEPTTEGKAMGSSLALGLITSLLQVFAPAAGAIAAKELGRHTDPETANSVANGMMNAVLGVAGHANPSQATDAEKIAAVAKVQADPALLKAAERSVVQQLSDNQPFLDKLHQQELDGWKASEESKDNAYKRNKETVEQTGGNPAQVFGLIIMGMVGFVVASVMWKDAIVAALGLKDVGGFSTDMQAFVIGAIVGSALTAVIQYVYGTNRSSAVKDQSISSMATSLASK